MRRSKSDPAKYARNYRKISQRHMTQYDHIDEEKEIERLRAVLRNSEEHMKKHAPPIITATTTASAEENNEEGEKELLSTTKASSNFNNSKSSNNNKKRKIQDDGASTTTTNGNDDDDQRNIKNQILSGELLEQTEYETAENPVIVLPSTNKKKAKKNKSKAVMQLTPEEIKEAKNLQKKTTRKLQQLETRAAQKKRRTQLLQKLQQTQLSKTAVPLLSSSGSLSRKNKDTKKQRLQKLLQKERAGIPLSETEKDLLYPERVVDEEEVERQQQQQQQQQLEKRAVSAADRKVVESNNNSSKNKNSDRSNEGSDEDSDECVPNNKNKKQKTSENQDIKEGSSSSGKTENSPEDTVKSLPTVHSQQKDDDKKMGDESVSNKITTGVDFAAQMMASISKLKEDTTKKSIENKDSDWVNALENSDNTTLADKKMYVPSSPTQLKTAASLGIQQQHSLSSISQRTVMRIQRPPEVEAKRLDLPVSAMEFEIVDAIRNNDITIICGETGSGKSTQVPQYLYENGLCTGGNGSDSPSFLIGITQPRRVAAVSTSKRVCYEMGQGDGQSIKGSSSSSSSGGSGNLVSYRTRYEKAGMGNKTRVQFMTDGILLQEIQNDLLLRRYSVIVLDESHERNLNTDVLIGLLSVAIPLRKKAAEEDPTNLVPLKLVLMSATLRVEDFTKNPKLFQGSEPPVVVKVPGRTHPVTVHHSKTTELDDYENVAFRKICKIHRNLPEGGILVFLTGKSEIIRMVNRLRKALQKDQASDQGRYNGSNDVSEQDNHSNDDVGPREMDDDDFDAENMMAEDDEDGSDDEADNLQPNIGHDLPDNVPKHACILPLYSLLPAEDQAKVFSPPPEGQRLIVIATNIAETSITIPGISYVVDTGRQKCRNYNSATGVVSYDVMWISRAAADQRAGRAGRTGPGHCYRLYSSSLYSRHMDPFALPEVLTRPLEDVVLAMKSLNISDVATFPFPTPPDRSQVDAAVKLLANLGCVDISGVEKDGGDGVVTRLGKAVSKLPLGVRYAKMLLAGAQAGVLDYAIVAVSVLSEASPFNDGNSSESDVAYADAEKQGDDISMDEIDQHNAKETESKKKKMRHWYHKSGDVLAATLAVGGFAYAGQGAGGASEQVACRKFCEENGLNFVIMTRIQKMRSNLARLAKARLSSAEGIAAKTGGFSSKMKPPNKLQERLLSQTIASGLLDNVAVLAPPGSFSGGPEATSRSGYISCTSSRNEVMFLDRSSVVYNKDYRQLPKWLCFNSVLRKTTKSGTPILVVKGATPTDPSWLGELSIGSRLLSFGTPLLSPPPRYNESKDCVECCVTTKFGGHGWEIPPVYKVMYDALHAPDAKKSSEMLLDDSFRWFARFLLQGKVLPELKELESILTDNPSIITKRKPLAKVSTIVSALSSAGIDSASALRKHWSEKDDKFLFKQMKSWIRQDSLSQGKKIWIGAVKSNIKQWKKRKAGA